MKRVGIYLWLMLKRMGKRPVYLALFLLFPAALFAVPKLNRAVGEERILVGYVMAEETPDIFDVEMKKEGELLYYVNYTDENKMRNDILTGELSCGIAFDKAFFEKIMEEDYLNCITLYLPEGMNVGGIVKEDVFRRVYQAYSAAWYARLLHVQGDVGKLEDGDEITAETVLEKFSEYQKKGKVFQVSYEVYEKEHEAVSPAVKTAGSAAVLSLRSVLAFMTLMSASLGALDGSRDRKRGLGKGISSPGVLAASAVGAPILLSTLFLAGAMVFINSNMTQMSYSGSGEVGIFGMTAQPGIWRALAEIGGAFLYGFMLWLFALFFSKIFSEKFLEGVMPCFLLIVLLCCPIFFDLGATVPVIGYVARLFPITWYLNGFG